MNQYKELKCWKKAMDLAELVYSITSNFPKEEKFGITAQMRRCVISIPSNIAEGSGRNSSKQFKYFLEIAMGSCNELETQIELSKRLKYIDEREVAKISEELDHIYRMIHNLYHKMND